MVQTKLAGALAAAPVPLRRSDPTGPEVPPDVEVRDVETPAASGLLKPPAVRVRILDEAGWPVAHDLRTAGDVPVPLGVQPRAPVVGKSPPAGRAHSGL
jgi:hypothetical protein